VAWTRYMPNVHLVRETPVASRARRLLHNPKACTYWHRGSRNWLVGIRMDKGGERGLHEFHCLNEDPDMTAGPQLAEDDVHDMAAKYYVPQEAPEAMQRSTQAQREMELTDEQAEYCEQLARRQAWARHHPFKVRTNMDRAWLGATLTQRK